MLLCFCLQKYLSHKLNALLCSHATIIWAGNIERIGGMKPSLMYIGVLPSLFHEKTVSDESCETQSEQQGG